MEKKRFIVGVSGASGAPLARRLLQELKEQEQVEVHLVMTDGGVRTADEEWEGGTEELIRKITIR